MRSRVELAKTKMTGKKETGKNQLNTEINK